VTFRPIPWCLAGTLLLFLCCAVPMCRGDEPAVPQVDETARVRDEYSAALNGLDDNMASKSRRLRIRMTIEDSEGTTSKELEVLGQGYFTALARAVAPAREKGTKMLRLQRQDQRLLYLCLPNTSRVIRLSGHMLRQSAMGSDLSYEDLLDAPRLGENYEIETGRYVDVDGRQCYDLQLKALSRSETYPTRHLVIERERHVPVLQELYAGGGMLLKRIEYSTYEQFGARHYPTRLVVRDLLRKTSKTTLQFSDIHFDVPLPAGAFTKRYLEREW